MSSQESAPAPWRPIFYHRAGVRLAGERWGGDPARPPVVLLHGGGQTRHSWGHPAQRLAAEGRTVLALDARGHGDSQWASAEAYRLSAFADDLVVVLKDLGRPATLVWASMGGITALTVAGEHPSLAAGLVLVDVVVKMEDDGVQRIRDFMTAAPNGFATLDEVADAVAAYNPNRRRPRNLDGLRKNVRLHADGRWHWHWDPAFMSDDADEPRSWDDRDRLRAAAAAVTVPTLIVHGRQSDVVSDAGLADMLELMPGAAVVDVQVAGPRSSIHLL